MKIKHADILKQVREKQNALPNVSEEFKKDFEKIFKKHKKLYERLADA